MRSSLGSTLYYVEVHTIAGPPPSASPASHTCACIWVPGLQAISTAVGAVVGQMGRHRSNKGVLRAPLYSSILLELLHTPRQNWDPAAATIQDTY